MGDCLSDVPRPCAREPGSKTSPEHAVQPGLHRPRLPEKSSELIQLCSYCLVTKLKKAACECQGIQSETDKSATMLPSLFGSSCLGFVYQSFLQQTSHARTQHAKAGLHEPGKHTLTGRKCAGILWCNTRRPCQEGGVCAQHAPFASLPWQCAPQPQGSGNKALPPAHSLKRKSSLPQRPRPASPLRLQPAATKSRTELSSGSRMLVGPGAGTGTPT